MSLLNDLNNKLNYTFYNLLVSSYTKNLYEKFFKNCKSNAKILDIGIGNGYAIIQNEKIIKSKNLKIYGVDIDDYSIKKCQENINKYNLNNNIKIINKDFFKLTQHDYQSFINNEYFDIVFYSNSYSVIPNINNFIIHSKKYIHEKGNIITSTTLYNDFDKTKDFIKKNLKHFLFNIDFGRIITHKMIEDEIKDMEFHIVSKKLVHKHNIPLWGDIKVFCLVIKPNI
jgi:cyclopropane fatty-acyl-phospholipid synthase-like methyltransferase